MPSVELYSSCCFCLQAEVKTAKIEEEEPSIMEVGAAVAQIEEEAPSPDTNDPGLLTCENSSATCMGEVDLCEKGHHKGLVSSANTNVGKDEVRGVDVIS